MKIVADLHVHSKYSRACSQELTLHNNAAACMKKGVNLLGTGDFTHPDWFKEIETHLDEREPGLFGLKDGSHAQMRFMITTEVAQIYKKGGKTRRIHNLLFVPSISSAKKVIAWLTDRGHNLKSDGRPILGIDSEELYKHLRDIDERIVLTPAHAWTPWFSVFGSKSGFDSLEECFGSMTPYVYAIETGLSSDPIMNRSLSLLDGVSLISNSDAHGPANFGREANVFEVEASKYSFDEMIRILRERDRKAFLYTIEFFPEEGKYHIDGHLACSFSCEPDETKRLGGKCPTCGKPITVGVLSRVNDLADRLRTPEVMQGHVPFKSIVPLPMLIADACHVRTTTGKKVSAYYEKLVSELGSEFYILLEASIADIAHASTAKIAEAVRRMRVHDVQISPGFDGKFGVVRVFTDKEQKNSFQGSLLE
jgi:DNA helicase-2/ATP-dependent DNA helicase PcrA